MSVADQITAVATSLGVDPTLALRVADRESGFNQDARGTHGEVGIFQVLPSTAAGMGCDAYSVAGNIQCGVTYLQMMLGQFGGDPFKAVAAYNAGPGRVSSAIQQYGAQWFDHIPASTQDYVLAVVPAAPPDTPTDQTPTTTLPIPLPGIAADFQPLALALLLGGALLVTYSAMDGGDYAWD